MRQHPGLSAQEVWARITAGTVRVNGETVRDPAARVSQDSVVTVQTDRPASRGEYKIGPILDELGLDVQGRVGLDAGAASGGFTAALLQRGASAVHAVDVGYNLIDYRLRQDPRVILHERSNIMDISSLEPLPRFAVCDLSFRSLRGAASHILSIPRVDWLLALIKPQFEAETQEVPDGGVIQDPALREAIVDRTVSWLGKEGLGVRDRRWSALAGSSGNLECFVLLVPASD